jgi:hypothetical protein
MGYEKAERQCSERQESGRWSACAKIPPTAAAKTTTVASKYAPNCKQFLSSRISPKLRNWQVRTGEMAYYVAAFLRPAAGVKFSICSGRPNTRILSPEPITVSGGGFRSNSPVLLLTATTVTPNRSRIRDSSKD